MPEFTVDVYVAAGLLDKPIDHRQSKAGILVRALGCKKRMKRFFKNLGRHASAIVGHRNHHMGARHDFRVFLRIFMVEMGKRGLECQSAAIGHGVPGIYSQVEDGGFELGAVNKRTWRFSARMHHEFNIFAKRPRNERFHAHDNFVYVCVLRFKLLLAGKGQQLFCQD